MNSTLGLSTIDELVHGQCRDPFAHLGQHRLQKGAVIRCLQPAAIAVYLLVDRRQPRQLNKTHEDGLFEIMLECEVADYELQIDFGEHQSITRDVYNLPSVVGELDTHLFAEGNHFELHRLLGSHVTTLEGTGGVSFALWAPNARRVSVIGEFNGWDGRVHVMRHHPGPGIWDIFIPGLVSNTLYKFEILASDGRVLPLKHDPFAPYFEQAPANASIVFESRFIWSDAEYLQQRSGQSALTQPVSVYEVHAGSWRLNLHGQSLTYRELADTLIPYVAENGFTHIELMPITEHPFTGSWGYQPIGLYAPTSRFGSPDDFRYFVDCCHAQDIGVVMDWVPAHFPTDEHGLGQFDGTHLYEHADPRQGYHQDWNTLIFNFGRREVANYLISNAVYWINEFHLDGLRVDAVASMLYLDYSREDGEWIPNQYGGRENLEAVEFLKRMNEAVHAAGGITFAEESTSYPKVSRPTYDGGLGFTFKWNMGWMHDTLDYSSQDPVHRKYHHNHLTFGLMYAFSENFLLPISHDEVVYGKHSMLAKMPGDHWTRFASLRATYAYMWTYPGKKLLFMGSEIAQDTEWDHDGSVHWDLLQRPEHAHTLHLVRELNGLYKSSPALYETDCLAQGFEWIDCDDAEQSVIAFYRYPQNREPGDAQSESRCLVVVCNFTPVVRHKYRIGVNASGRYAELLNSDDTQFGGSGVLNGTVVARSTPCHNRPCSLELTLPPLALAVFQYQAD